MVVCEPLEEFRKIKNNKEEYLEKVMTSESSQKILEKIAQMKFQNANKEYVKREFNQKWRYNGEVKSKKIKIVRKEEKFQKLKEQRNKNYQTCLKEGTLKKECNKKSNKERDRYNYLLKKEVKERYADEFEEISISSLKKYQEEKQKVMDEVVRPEIEGYIQ